MEVKQDIEKALKNGIVMKIDGQPTDEDLNQLEWELSALAVSIPTKNGGEMHGHVGMLLKDS